jgi:hypothetical protein
MFAHAPASLVLMAKNSMGAKQQLQWRNRGRRGPSPTPLRPSPPPQHTPNHSGRSACAVKAIVSEANLNLNHTIL